MVGCPDASELSAFAEGALQLSAISRLQDHLDGCSSCFTVIATLARGDDMISITRSAEPASSESPPTWRHTRRIAEYRLVRPIGRGAGGQVWLADDTLLERQVAIKFVSTATHVRARERFQIEARAIARLSHPNVVTLHRVGEVDGQPYLVSELVRGKSLDRLELPVPWQRARELGIGLARGLAAAHDAGIVHRDLKPSNAILGDDGTVKLLDFGLAKLPDTRDDASAPSSELPPAALPKLTATGHLLGTPLYMAPEAWGGAAPTFSMDVYSLGALLYELVCGHPPHIAGSVAEVRRAALGGRLRAIGDLVPDLDPGFARVIMKCLATVPAERFATGAALRDALEVPPELPIAKSRRWHLAIASLAISIGVAGAAWGLSRPRSSGVPPAAPVIIAPGPAPATPRARQRCSADRWCWDIESITAVIQAWGAARDDVWIVGGRGLIRHFDGHTWRDVATSTVADLFGISGSSATDVWVVGLWGTCLHWDGSAWKEVATNTKESLGAVWAHTSSDAWIVGERGLALHWDGIAWTKVATPATQRLYRVSGTAADDVWAFGYGTAIHWDGRAWHETDLHAREHIGALRIVSSHDIWVAGFHSVFRHWNGRDWERIAIPEVAGSAKRREDFPINGGDGVGSNELWLVAKGGGILHRDAAGAWSLDDQHTDRELFALAAISHDDAWAVGTANAVVHWDGRAWTPATPEVPERMIYGIWGGHPRDVWAIGETREPQSRGFAEHFDGDTWTEIPLPPGTARLRAITGRGDERYAVGAGGVLLAWRDGAWQREKFAAASDFAGVWSDAPGRAWAVAEDGTIARRDRDGTWHATAHPAVGPLYAVWGAGPGAAWAVGAKGAILRLDGETWSAVDASPTQETLMGVWGANAGDVWAVGTHGATLHWDGKKWATVFSDFDQPLNAVAGWSPTDVWAVSNTDQGTNSIIHWNGEQWTQVDRTTHEPLAAVWAVGPGEAWASGWWATLLHHVRAE